MKFRVITFFWIISTLSYLVCVYYFSNTSATDCIIFLCPKYFFLQFSLCYVREYAIDLSNEAHFCGLHELPFAAVVAEC